MSHIGQTITATGEVWGGEGDASSYVNINLSEIFTILIQEAGRWCESYASDLLVDIDCMKKALSNPDGWTEDKHYRKTEDGNDAVYFRLGFRQGGVDHREYIDYAMEHDTQKYYYYRSIWDLWIEKDARGRVTATLRRTA